MPRRPRSSALNLPDDIKLEFATRFCPLWRDYLGTLANPWDIDNNLIDEEMQACFDIVFPDSNHGEIKKNDNVHKVVSQNESCPDLPL